MNEVMPTINFLDALVSHALPLERLMTPNEVIAHLSKGTGYYVSVDPFQIEGYKIYEVVKSKEIPGALQAQASQIVDPFVKEGFSAETMSGEKFVAYAFADGKFMVTYIVVGSAHTILSVAGRILAEISIGRDRITMMNLNAAFVVKPQQNARLYRRLNDAVLRRFHPHYICTSTMNPRVISAATSSLEQNGYEVIVAEPDKPLSQWHQGVFTVLFSGRFLEPPLPDEYGVRRKQFPGLQEEAALRSLWQDAEKYPQLKRPLALKQAGLFAPVEGDQLFIIGVKDIQEK